MHKIPRQLEGPRKCDDCLLIGEVLLGITIQTK